METKALSCSLQNDLAELGVVSPFQANLLVHVCLEEHYQESQERGAPTDHGGQGGVSMEAAAW